MSSNLDNAMFDIVLSVQEYVYNIVHVDAIDDSFTNGVDNMAGAAKALFDRIDVREFRKELESFVVTGSVIGHKEGDTTRIMYSVRTSYSCCLISCLA